MVCNGVCTNVATDNANCGTCENPCVGEEVCSAGLCNDTCGVGYSVCGTTCADVQDDPNHCGACDTPCAPGELCASGSCTDPCLVAGNARCGGACVNTENDPNNCGACGNDCGAAACVAGVCSECGRFDGTQTGTWQVLATSPSDLGAPGATDYTPAGQTGWFLLEDSSMAYYDPTTNMWTSVAAPPFALDGWPGAAWIGNSLYVIKAGSVIQYDIPTNAWSTPLMGGVHDNDQNTTTHNTDGTQLYTITTVPEIATYDIATNSMSYTAYAPASAGESHSAWDVCSSKLYISADFSTPNLDSYDPATGAVTALAPIPESKMNDIFCGDRSGHLYAAGNSSGTTFWKYDIATNPWSQLPDLPFDQGNNGACGVSNDGWLYVTSGNNNSVARIQLN
jgi:hypothetical protein